MSTETIDFKEWKGGDVLYSKKTQLLPMLPCALSSTESTRIIVCVHTLEELELHCLALQRTITLGFTFKRHPLHFIHFCHAGWVHLLNWNGNANACLDIEKAKNGHK